MTCTAGPQRTKGRPAASISDVPLSNDFLRAPIHTSSLSLPLPDYQALCTAGRDFITDTTHHILPADAADLEQRIMAIEACASNLASSRALTLPEESSFEGTTRELYLLTYEFVLRIMTIDALSFEDDATDGAVQELLAVLKAGAGL
jgi:hypothetical protein